jgi:hypothetical protein
LARGVIAEGFSANLKDYSTVLRLFGRRGRHIGEMNEENPVVNHPLVSLDSAPQKAL